MGTSTRNFVLFPGCSAEAVIRKNSEHDHPGNDNTPLGFSEARSFPFLVLGSSAGSLPPAPPIPRVVADGFR
jgi:hypothetical protein